MQILHFFVQFDSCVWKGLMHVCMYSKHNGEEEEYVLLFLFKVVMWYSKNTWNVLQIMLQYLLITTLPKL